MASYWRLDGVRARVQILPGADQRHLGGISTERPAGEGLLQGIRALDCEGEVLPRGLCGVKGGAGLLAGGEIGRLMGLSGHIGWGGASAPADCIRRPIEVPPEGVGLFATRHHRHRYGISSVLDDALRDIFLPALFQGDVSNIPSRVISDLPVKQVGIALPDPMQTAGENWVASCIITRHLVAVLRRTAKFR